MGQYLFSFHGRINRAKLWAFLLIIVAFYVVAALAIVFAIGPQHIADVANGAAKPETLFSGAVLVVCGILGLVVLALIWAGFAVLVKRLHDRNKSAWWLLVFYLLPLVLNVPRQMALWRALQDGTYMQAAQNGGAMAIGGPIAILAGGAATIISLWAFVELYCLRGTAGDNRYGADPLAGKA
ncbi:MAG TPA: DUF805 domain-containing protein [Rhizomicrobium sp.]